MFRDLFALNQRHLPFRRFTVARLASEIPAVLHDPLPCYELQFGNRPHGLTTTSAMHMQRSDKAAR